MSIASTIRRRRLIAAIVPRFDVGPFLGGTGGNALAVQWLGHLLLIGLVRPPIVSAQMEGVAQ